LPAKRWEDQRTALLLRGAGAVELSLVDRRSDEGFREQVKVDIFRARASLRERWSKRPKQRGASRVNYGCSFTEKISSLIDGELAPAEAREVERHLLNCGECEQVRADFLNLRSQIASFETSTQPLFRTAR
jgi:hypothetical protein